MKTNFESVIGRTAKLNNVSAEEVRAEISRAAAEGMKSESAEARRFWERFGGKQPSPEELIENLIGYINSKMK